MDIAVWNGDSRLKSINNSTPTGGDAPTGGHLPHLMASLLLKGFIVTDDVGCSLESV